MSTKHMRLMFRFFSSPSCAFDKYKSFYVVRRQYCDYKKYSASLAYKEKSLEDKNQNKLIQIIKFARVTRNVDEAEFEGYFLKLIASSDPSLYFFLQRSYRSKEIDSSPLTKGHLSSFIPSFDTDKITKIDSDGFLSFRPQQLTNLRILAELPVARKKREEDQENSKVVKIPLEYVKRGKFFTWEEENRKYVKIINNAKINADGIVEKKFENQTLYLLRVPLKYITGRKIEEVIKQGRVNIKQIKENRHSCYKLFNGILFEEYEEKLWTLYQTKAYNCITPVINQFALKEDSSIREGNSPVIKRNPATQVALFGFLLYVLDKISEDEKPALRELEKLFKDMGLFDTTVSDSERIFKVPLSPITYENTHHVHLYGCDSKKSTEGCIELTQNNLENLKLVL